MTKPEIRHRRRLRTRFVAAAACIGAIASSCTFGPQFEERAVSDVNIAIRVSNEAGDPIADADLLVGDDTMTTNDRGIAVVTISAPTVVTVTADGHLDEPVVVGPTDETLDVNLWARSDADGNSRTSLHFGGDMMLGRRYLDPDLPTPHVDDADSARRIVASLAPITSAADWTSVNLETVVGNLSDDDALPAKRFLLQSTPLVTEALDEMGVDLVTLGNNHAYDWGDAGIVATLDVLDDAGIDHVGAGMSREDAVRGTIVDIGGLQLGVVSLTTVTGSFVNDQLPSADADVPADLDPTEAWQYQLRQFQYRSANGSLTVEPTLMRISEVWEIVEDAENDESFIEHADLWSAARSTFPELQDWVARRGHGGAAPYERNEMESELARLRSEGADMVVVQVHGGFQFADVNSSFLRNVSYAAIDAGADAVVSHHPHVLQGVEWYNDALIAYSLGNLVFDQGFSATFPGAVLRLITDGDDIVEARLLPIMLDRYRPVPVVGDSAQRIIRTVDARTALPATSSRVDGLIVGSVLDDVGPDARVGAAAIDTTARSAAVVFERNSGLIVRDRSAAIYATALESGESETLPPCAVARTDNLTNGTEIGTDLFDWGGFDLAAARVSPAVRPLPINWLVLKDESRWNYTDGPSGDDFDRALELFTDTDQKTTVRWSARVDVDAHRLFDSDGQPVDAPATYEIVMDARRTRGELPSMRLISFDFDDTDPTTDPETERLNEVVLSLPVPDDGEWHRVSVDVPAEFVAPGPNGHAVNTAMLLIDAPPALRGQLAIDNVAFIEWRGATSASIPTWVEADMVRSTAASEPGVVNRIEITTSGC